MKHLYLILDGYIHASVTLEESLEKALVEVTRVLARKHMTSYRIAPRSDIAPEGPAESLLIARLIAHDGVEREAVGEFTDPKELAVMVVENVEVAFNSAFGEFQNFLERAAVGHDDSVPILQGAYEKVRTAATRAAAAHPPISIDVDAEVKSAMSETAWTISNGAIHARWEEIRIAAFTAEFEWESKAAIMFKYSLIDGEPWRDAIAYLIDNGHGGKVVERNRSWLHERKRQKNLNDDTIEAIYDSLDLAMLHS